MTFEGNMIARSREYGGSRVSNCVTEEEVGNPGTIGRAVGSIREVNPGTQCSSTLRGLDVSALRPGMRLPRAPTLDSGMLSPRPRPAGTSFR